MNEDQAVTDGINSKCRGCKGNSVKSRWVPGSWASRCNWQISIYQEKNKWKGSHLLQFSSSLKIFHTSTFGTLGQFLILGRRFEFQIHSNRPNCDGD